MTPTSTGAVVRGASTWSILWGVLLILLGLMAIAFPLAATVAANAVIAWLIVLAGLVHLVLAFHAHGAGSILWRVLVGLAYLGFGIYLILHPIVGIVTFTLLLATLFFIEGIFNIILFFQMRSSGGSVWFLLDGIITLLLGLFIYIHWPSSSVWAIGTLVGVSMITSGITRVMVSMTVRRLAAGLP
jgi:uncharacterized membrane protein HdeD (DUF308 family)